MKKTDKIAKVVATILYIALIITLSSLYINSKNEIIKKDTEINNLHANIKNIELFIPKDDARCNFIAFGDSVISANTSSNLSVAERNIYLNSLWYNCMEFNVNPYIMLYLGEEESDFRKNVVSNANAKGIHQMLPSTYRLCAMALHENYEQQEIFNIEKQTRYSTFYLKLLLEDCNNIELALSRYNEGHTNNKNAYSARIMLKYNKISKYI